MVFLEEELFVGVAEGSDVGLNEASALEADLVDAANDARISINHGER